MKKCIVLLVLVEAILSSCGAGREERGDERLNSVVKTSKVEFGVIEEELLLNAKVACNERSMRKIYIPCTGKIGDVTVEVGDRVKRGELLAVVSSLDAASYQKELSVFESGLRVAERNLITASELFGHGMLSVREYNDASEEVVRLKAEHERLKAVANINGYHDSAKANILSPISGYVMTKSIYNDSYIDDTNKDQPAFEIADISEVWVIADVYENDIAKVQEGANVKVSTLAWPGVMFDGKIDKRFNMIDPESKTMKVRVALRNPDEILIPGIFASVHVATESSRMESLKVPSESVVFENGQNYVILKRGSSFDAVSVDVLRMDMVTTWIEGNLQRGDEVVTQNALLMFNDIKSAR